MRIVSRKGSGKSTIGGEENNPPIQEMNSETHHDELLILLHVDAALHPEKALPPLLRLGGEDRLRRRQDGPARLLPLSGVGVVALAHPRVVVVVAVVADVEGRLQHGRGEAGPSPPAVPASSPGAAGATRPAVVVPPPAALLLHPPDEVERARDRLVRPPDVLVGDRARLAREARGLPPDDA
ncbi:hypothetical protein THAOC_23860, partial [Thalassiosira oceanica]